MGTWTQTYGYDAANRLSTSSETGSGSWTENFGYDTRGNRWVVFPTTTGLTLSSETPQSPTAELSDWFGTDNRVVSGHGWTYDGAGNVTAIGGMPRTFAYDAEGRQISATVNGTATTYAYDGDGRRVMKTVGGVVTV